MGYRGTLLNICFLFFWYFLIVNNRESSAIVCKGKSRRYKTRRERPENLRINCAYHRFCFSCLFFSFFHKYVYIINRFCYTLFIVNHVRG